MSQSEESGPEKFFNGDAQFSSFTINLLQLREKNTDLTEALAQSDMPSEVKSIISSAFAKKGDLAGLGEAILTANACDWRYGPCGSCYNDRGRYAYAVRCDGGAWQYGCGYCT